MPVRGLSRRASAGRADTALTSAGSAASSGTTRGVPTGRVAPGRSMAAGAGRRWRQLATSVLTGRAPSVRPALRRSGFEPPPRGRPSAAKGTGCASPPTRLVPSLWMAGNTTSYNQRDAPLNSVNPVKTKRRMVRGPGSDRRTATHQEAKWRSAAVRQFCGRAADKRQPRAPRQWADDGGCTALVRRHPPRGPPVPSAPRRAPELRNRQVPRWSCTQRPASSRRERSRPRDLQVIVPDQSDGLSDHLGRLAHATSW
jgi:hypothetical protein